ncbi:MAG: hypothetical protein CM15mP120_23920 [Pseudomonadota bacterium]|nr:MAG: hypothetical protein CM15mP120_23920 [Pseudomonadota bacterium]
MHWMLSNNSTPTVLRHYCWWLHPRCPVWHEPKDFDVATDAPLDEVKRIFRRSRIVADAFRSLMFDTGATSIEVSTFRQSISENIEHDAQGMILRDKAYGTLQEDAFRRDLVSMHCISTPTTMKSSTTWADWRTSQQAK